MQKKVYILCKYTKCSKTYTTAQSKTRKNYLNRNVNRPSSSAQVFELS